MKQILQYPDRRLTIVSSKVADFKEAKTIVEELVEVTKSVDRPWNIWLGMAAPQIGYNRRVLILKNSLYNYQVMVNPEITEQRMLGPMISRCYSLKGLYLKLGHYWTKVKYQDLTGKHHAQTIKGGRALALQHEVDHLNGILINQIGKRII